jgi:hypothetical protein
MLFFMYGASEDPFATAGLNILLYEFEYVMQYDVMQYVINTT